MVNEMKGFPFFFILTTIRFEFKKKNSIGSGLPFCALLNRFRPNLFNYQSIVPVKKSDFFFSSSFFLFSYSFLLLVIYQRKRRRGFENHGK